MIPISYVISRDHRVWTTEDHTREGDSVMRINCRWIVSRETGGVPGLLVLSFAILLSILAGAAGAQQSTFDTVTHRSDVNGDGRTDILWRNTSTGDVAAWLMDASGVAVAAVPFYGRVDLTWQIKGIGDFNGDGRADVLWQHNSGTVVAWLMNASGTAVFSIPVFGVVADANWQIKGIGDFNGDGRADVLWQHNSGTVVAWLMNTSGTGISSIPTIGSVPNRDWVIKGVGDFNGDGRFDILWQHTSGIVVNWLMNGTAIGVYSISYPYPGGVPDSNWSIEGIGDFDGNGRSDILWRHTAGSVAIWLMNLRGKIESLPVFTGLDASWAIRGIGDFNANGQSDILWQNLSGEVAIWSMGTSGTRLIPSLSFNVGGPAADWSIVNFPTGGD